MPCTACNYPENKLYLQTLPKCTNKLLQPGSPRNLNSSAGDTKTFEWCARARYLVVLSCCSIEGVEGTHYRGDLCGWVGGVLLPWRHRDRSTMRMNTKGNKVLRPFPPWPRVTPHISATPAEPAPEAGWRPVWAPAKCSDCHIIGHKQLQCPNHTFSHFYIEIYF